MDALPLYFKVNISFFYVSHTNRWKGKMEKRSQHGTTGGALEFVPLTPERWTAFESLFGERGACGGCWCMWWRLRNAEYQRAKGEGNRRAMRKLVNGGVVPGILALSNGEPVGWCALAPREEYPRLSGSRVLKPLDERRVWSIVCFFVKKAARRQGVSERLIRAAVEHAERDGATCIEAYPIDPSNSKQADVFVFSGLLSAFIKSGFKEVARRSPTRPIVRYTVHESESRKVREGRRNR